MAKDYIPRANAEFNNFQQNLVKYVAANATTWKIPADDVTALQEASVKYGNFYKSISNKGDRTKSQVDAHDIFRKSYESDLRVFVNSFLRSNKNISSSDLTGMGIKARGKKRRQRTKIDTAPELFIESKGGLRLRFVCRITSHYGKGSIHPESDGLELRYVIGTEPKGFNDAPVVITSSKAHFWLEFLPEHQGKKIYVFARWKNNVNDNLSGPWSARAEGLIF